MKEFYQIQASIKRKKKKIAYPLDYHIIYTRNEFRQ